MKAILVIDIPKECCECNLSNAGTSPSDNWCCSGLTVKTKTIYGEYDTRRIIKLEDIHKVQDWCPLKPMPTKKIAVFDPNCCDIEEEIKIIHEIDGYNRCIDEILGEEVCK